MICALSGVVIPIITVAQETADETVDALNRVVVISEHGLNPRELEMSAADSTLLFLNKSRDSLLTLEIDYGARETHCASPDLRIEEGGKIRSKRPVPPGDFSSVCFHDRGEYLYTVFGVSGAPAGISGKVVVR